MSTTRIGYGTRIGSHNAFEEAVAKVPEALRSEGFGVLTNIDIQETLKAKLDAYFRRYVILGACNPPLAYQALSKALEIGLFLPCDVIVYEENGSSVISVVYPISMLDAADNPELKSIAVETQERLRRVVERIEGES
jgi:uncharacterized protein (DUF302 family)